MEIRQATREDLPSIIRLLADDPIGGFRERAEEPLPAEYFKAFDDIQNQSGNEVIVADENGRVVGCLQISFIAKLSRLGMMRAQVEGVRVDKDCRGQGIGEALMTVAEDRARARQCGIVQLTTDVDRPDARRFYERLGYVASHAGMKLAL